MFKKVKINISTNWWFLEDFNYHKLKSIHSLITTKKMNTYSSPEFKVHLYLNLLLIDSLSTELKKIKTP